MTTTDVASQPKFDDELFLFGCHVESENIVCVTDVPRGMDCGCVCPSCRIPLIAQKGKINRWHFRHNSRSESYSKDTICDYSPYVWLRIFARKLFQDGLTINLPRLVGTVSTAHPLGTRYISEEYSDITERRITLTNPKLTFTFEEVSVDVCAEVDGYKFLIYLIHEQRQLPISLLQPSDKKCGIISISLTQILFNYCDEIAEGHSFEAFLKKQIKENTAIKSWVFNPRQEKMRKQAELRLQDKISTIRKGLNGRTVKPYKL